MFALGFVVQAKFRANLLKAIILYWFSLVHGWRDAKQSVPKTWKVWLLCACVRKFICDGDASTHIVQKKLVGFQIEQSTNPAMQFCARLTLTVVCNKWYTITEVLAYSKNVTIFIKRLNKKLLFCLSSTNLWCFHNFRILCSLCFVMDELFCIKW